MADFLEGRFARGPGHLEGRIGSVGVRGGTESGAMMMAKKAKKAKKAKGEKL